MKTRIIFILILLFSVFPTTVVYADKLQDDPNNPTYILYDAINSGGGTLTSDAYILMDSKGDALSGIMTKDNYTFIPGLFGLLGAGGTVEGQVPPSVDLNDTGRIRGTWVERNPQGVILHWGYDNLGPTPVDIYIKLGGQFTKTAGDYTKIDSADINTTSKPIDNSKFTDKVAYFRVVPDAAHLVVPDIMNDKNNSITAARISYDLTKEFNLINLPIYPTSSEGDPKFHVDGNLNHIVQEQLADGCSIYSWNMSDPDKSKWVLDKALYVSGKFTALPFTFVVGKGCWIYRPLDDTLPSPDLRNLVMAGIIKNTDFSGTIEASFNLIGSPYTTNYKLSTFGFGSGPADGDSWYKWNGSFLDKITYISGWKDANGNLLDDNVLMNNGYWYYRFLTYSKFDWKLTKP